MEGGGGGVIIILLPSGSEQHEVLLFGSIQEGILQPRQLIVKIERTQYKIGKVG